MEGGCECKESVEAGCKGAGHARRGRQLGRLQPSRPEDPMGGRACPGSPRRAGPGRRQRLAAGINLSTPLSWITQASGQVRDGRALVSFGMPRMEKPPNPSRGAHVKHSPQVRRGNRKASRGDRLVVGPGGGWVPVVGLRGAAHHRSSAARGGQSGEAFPVLCRAGQDLRAGVGGGNTSEAVLNRFAPFGRQDHLDLLGRAGTPRGRWIKIFDIATRC